MILNVCSARANNLDIILADEPTSSLNEENTEPLMSLLNKINEENKLTIIMIATDLYKKLPANMNYFLKNGRLSEVTQEKVC